VLDHGTALGASRIKQGQIDTIADRTAVQNSVIVRFLYQFAQVLARHIVNRRALRENRSGQFFAQPTEV